MFLTTVNVNPYPLYPYRFYIRNGRDIFLLIISLVYYYDSSVLLGLLSFQLKNTHGWKINSLLSFYVLVTILFLFTLNRYCK